ncbi:MAG: hypothetical protein R3E88_03525 [Myxococcota bacterium]
MPVDVDELELLEFLEADLLPSPAHPAFRRQLRDHLRALLRERGTLPARAGACADAEAGEAPRVRGEAGERAEADACTTADAAVPADGEGGVDRH